MRALLAALLLFGCGSRSTLEVTSVDASAPLPDSGPATPPPPPPPPPPPRAECVAVEGGGGAFGAVPGVDIAYRFMVAGIEAPSGHSCPRVFLRAGVDPAFEGSHLDIEVPYTTDAPIAPGPRRGTLTVRHEGEVWTEELTVDVRRADGLFDRSLPAEEWRASLDVSHHDATTDLEIEAESVPYCDIFPLCI